MNPESRQGRNPQPASLTAIMQAQLQALSRIEEILEHERDALERRDPDSLLNVADTKNRALADLGELERQRKALSANLEAEHAEELRAIASRCRAMNTQNAALLNSQQVHVARLLNLLRGGTDSRPAAYDARGRTATTASRQLRLTEV